MRKVKFLLDENVRIELAKFLKSQNFDTTLATKSTSDSTLASTSKGQKRILVTNDQDFADCSRDKIFSVILLRVSQNDAKLLVKSFEKLLGEFDDFLGNLVVLGSDGWESFPLTEEIEV